MSKVLNLFSRDRSRANGSTKNSNGYTLVDNPQKSNSKHYTNRQISIWNETVVDTPDNVKLTSTDFAKRSKYGSTQQRPKSVANFMPTAVSTNNEQFQKKTELRNMQEMKTNNSNTKLPMPGHVMATSSTVSSLKSILHFGIENDDLPKNAALPLVSSKANNYQNIVNQGSVAMQNSPKHQNVSQSQYHSNSNGMIRFQNDFPKVEQFAGVKVHGHVSQPTLNLTHHEQDTLSKRAEMVQAARAFTPPVPKPRTSLITRNPAPTVKPVPTPRSKKSLQSLEKIEVEV